MMRILPLLFSLFFMPTAHALQYVLDTEINATFRSMLMELDPDLAPSVKLHLGISPEMNAFVTEGQRMFIFSGLIEKTETASELQGVLAHELAHLKAGHLEQGRYAQELAQKRSIFSTLLGIGAAVAGAPEAAGAVILSGQAEAQSGVLRHSRTAENEADNIAATYLTKAGYGLEGMVNFFRKLHSHTQLRFGSMPPYLLTHPLPSERVDSLNNKLTRSSIQSGKTPSVDFDMFKAKVYALSHSPNQVFRTYHGDESAAANYARAIAFAIQGNASDAKLAFTKIPPSPYVSEILGDIDLDSGNLSAAKKHFLDAQNALKSPLISYKLAKVTQAQNKPAEALGYIKQMFPAYSHFAPAWQLRGVLEGQAGNKAESHVALAEAAFRTGDIEAVRLHIRLAEKFITDSSTSDAHLQLHSLKRELEEIK